MPFGEHMLYQPGQPRLVWEILVGAKWKWKKYNFYRKIWVFVQKWKIVNKLGGNLKEIVNEKIDEDEYKNLKKCSLLMRVLWSKI